MLQKKKRKAPEVDSSSMADIAFLLLIFFLVTTTIASDKGIMMQLPPLDPNDTQVEIRQRNVFKVLVNSSDQLLVEDQPMELDEIKDECKKFLTNNGRDPESSESPQDAITSIKTDRGTTYAVYIEVLDEVKRAYHEVRAEHIGITLEEYLALEKDDTKHPDYKRYEKAKDAYPMQISEAEPSKVGG